MNNLRALNLTNGKMTMRVIKLQAMIVDVVDGLLYELQQASGCGTDQQNVVCICSKTVLNRTIRWE